MRQSEPAPIPSRPYKVGDVWHVGSDPRWLCSTCKLIKFDPVEYRSCPGYRYREYLHWQQLADDYRLTGGGPLYPVVTTH